MSYRLTYSDGRVISVLPRGLTRTAIRELTPLIHEGFNLQLRSGGDWVQSPSFRNTLSRYLNGQLAQTVYASPRYRILDPSGTVTSTVRVDASRSQMRLLASVLPDGWSVELNTSPEGDLAIWVVSSIWLLVSQEETRPQPFTETQAQRDQDDNILQPSEDVELAPSSFPDGPLNEEELMNLDPQELHDLEVTPENMLQIAFYGDRIDTDTLRYNQLPYQSITKEQILHTATRRNLFRSWPSWAKSKVMLLAQNFQLVQAGRLISPEAYIYLRPVYFFDEATRSVVRCGPFMFRFRKNEYKPLHKLSIQKAHYAGTLSSGEFGSKWQRMVHPHISEGSATQCVGTEESAFCTMHQNKDLLGLAMATEDLLVNYNPESPHRRFVRHFRPSVAYPPEALVRRVAYSSHNGRFEYVTSYQEPNRRPTTIAGLNVRLDHREKREALARPGEFVGFLIQRAQNFIINPSHASDQGLFPEGESAIEQIRRAGINVDPGFNTADVPLTAQTIRHERSECIVFNIEEQQSDDETTGDGDASEAEAGSTTEEAVPVGGEAEDEDHDEEEVQF